MGYRYLTWEFDDNDTGGDTFNDLTIKGPMIGGNYFLLIKQFPGCIIAAD